jgi:hypothetical protein
MGLLIASGATHVILRMNGLWTAVGLDIAFQCALGVLGIALGLLQVLTVSGCLVYKSCRSVGLLLWLTSASEPY